MVVSMQRVIGSSAKLIHQYCRIDGQARRTQHCDTPAKRRTEVEGRAPRAHGGLRQPGICDAVAVQAMPFGNTRPAPDPDASSRAVMNTDVLDFSSQW
jgi:hypothetical protein